MYEKFFFLKEKPFHITPDPRFLFLSKKHAEALDLLAFGINERKGFILLTGEVGTGKTTICRALLERLPKKTESALILNPVLSEHDLLKTITADFGLNVESDGARAHLDALNAFLLRVASAGGNAVVIIDEAQNLSTATLEMVRLLSNLETEKEKLLQIVMVGQPELGEKLKMPELRQLNQRIVVRCELDPLGPEETEAYVMNRLLVAGGRGSLQFKNGALGLVHALSRGVPRLINIICDRTLVAAFVEERRSVDTDLVRKASEDLKMDGCVAAGRSPVMAARQAGYMPHIIISSFVIALIAMILAIFR
jgi:general secretion pathway protein A